MKKESTLNNVTVDYLLNLYATGIMEHTSTFYVENGRIFYESKDSDRCMQSEA